METRASGRLPVIVGLLVGAAGIAVLWAGGQDFPVYPPPGILILGAGALVVAFAPWRWAPAVGAALALFVIVGFVLAGINSDDGFGNITGDEGAARMLGQVVQLIGVGIALVAGVRATRTAYRTESVVG